MCRLPKNRANVAASILQSPEVLEAAYNASSQEYKGSAQQELDKYLDSITAKIQAFTNEVHQFWTGLISSDAVKFFVDLGTTLLNTINTVGQFKSAIIATAAVLATKKLGIFTTNIIDDRKQLLLLGKDLKSFVNSGLGALKMFGNGIKNFISDRRNGDDTKFFSSYLKFGGGISQEEINLLTNEYNAFSDVMSENVGKSAKQLSDEIGGVDERVVSYIENTSAAERSSSGFAASLTGISAKSKLASVGLSILSTGLNALITFGISMAISKIFQVFDNYINRIEKTKQAVKSLESEYSSSQTNITSHEKTISDISKRYEELSKGVNEYGENIGLTADEFAEYHDITKQIYDMYPNLIQGFDEQGEAIARYKGNIDELNKSLKEEKILSYNTILDGADDVLKAYHNTRGTGKENEYAGKFLQEVLDVYAETQTYDELEDALNILLQKWMQNSINEDGSSNYDYEALFKTLNNLKYVDVFDKEKTYNTTNKGAVIDELKTKILEYQNDMDSAIQSVINDVMLPTFWKYLINNESSVINDNENLNKFVTTFIQSIDSKIIDELPNGNYASGWLLAFLGQIENAMSDPSASDSLSQALNVLFGNAMTDASGNLLSGVSPTDYLIGIKTAINTITKELDLSDDIKVELKDAFNLKEFGDLSSKYVEGVIDLSKHFKDANFNDIDKYMKENKINTSDGIIEFFNTISKAIEDGVKTWDQAVVYWNNTIESKTADTRLSMSDLFADNSKDKDIVSQFQTNIKQIGDAIANFNDLSPEDKISLYSSFAKGLEGINNAGEITEEVLRKLAQQQWETLDATLAEYDGMEELRKALQAFADQALSGNSSIKKSLYDIAGVPTFSPKNEQEVLKYDAELNNSIDDYKKLLDYTKFFTDGQKKLWVESTSGVKGASEAIKMYEDKLASISFDDLKDLLSDETFQDIRTAAEQINEIIKDGITGDERQTLIESYGLTEQQIKNGLVNKLQNYLNNIVYMYAQKGGEAGAEFYNSWIKSQKLDTFDEIIKDMATTTFPNGVTGVNTVTLKNFNDQIKTMSNAEKDLFVGYYRDGRKFYEILADVQKQMKAISNKSLPDLLNNDTFGSLISEAEELSSILDGGINNEELISLYSMGFTDEDIQNDIVNALYDHIQDLIKLYTDGAGEAGKAWYEKWTKTIFDNKRSLTLSDFLNIEFDYEKDGKLIRTTLDEYTNEIKSRAQTVGQIVSAINSKPSEEGHLNWAEILGNADQLKELEAIMPGISTKIRDVVNGTSSENKLIELLIITMADLYDEYEKNVSGLVDINNMTDEASEAWQNYNQTVKDTTDYSVAMKNGLLDIADSLDKIYFDRAYDGARSFGQAITDVKGEIDTLNTAYTSLIDPELRENSVEFKNLVADLVAQFPELTSHTGSIKELALAVTELMESKSNNLIIALEELASRTGIPVALKNEIETVTDSLRKLGTQPFSMDNVINVIKNARNEMNQFAEFVKKVNETGLHLNIEATDEVYNLYPELLRNAEIYRDGTIKLNKDIYEAFKKSKEAEIQGDVQARIKELENMRALASAELDIEKKKLEIATEAIKSKSGAEMEAALAKIAALDEEAKANAEARLSMAEDDADYTGQGLENTDKLAKETIENIDEVGEATADALTQEGEMDTEASQDKIDNSNDVTENATNNLSEEVDTFGEAKSAETEIDEEASTTMNDNSTELSETEQENQRRFGEFFVNLLNEITGHHQEASETMDQNSETVGLDEQTYALNAGETTENVIRGVAGISEEASQMVDSNGEILGDNLQGNILDVGSTATNAINEMTQTIADGAYNAENNAYQSGEAIKGTINNLITLAHNFADAYAAAGEGRKAGSGMGVVGVLGNTLGGIVKGFKTTASNMWDAVKKPLLDTGNTIKDSITGMFSGLFGNGSSSSYNGTLTGKIYASIKDTLGIGKKKNGGFTKFVGDLGTKIIDGVNGAFKNSREKIDNIGVVFNNIIGALSGGAETIIDGAKNFVYKLQNIKDGDAEKAVITGIQKLGNKLSELVGKPKVSDKIRDQYAEFIAKLNNIIENSTDKISALELEIANYTELIEYLKANGGLALQDWIDQLNKEAAAKDNNGSGSDKGGDGSGRDGSDADDAKEDANEFSEIIDWIEVKIKRIEREISNLDKIVGNSFRTYTKRASALREEMDKVVEEMDITQQAYIRYMIEAESIALDEEYKRKVRNGLIDIENIMDENLRDAIKLYEEWYEKAVEQYDKLLDLAQQVSNLHQQAFQMIQDESDNILSHYESTVNMINNSMQRTEQKGYVLSKKYYEQLVQLSVDQMKVLETERVKLIKEFQSGLNDGSIQEYSAEWYSMRNAIDEVTLSIDNLRNSIVEYQEAMKQLQWDMFDMQQDRISNITKENDFLIDLMSNYNLYNNEGYITNRGITTKGLHLLNYDIDMAMADQYREEMLRINEELAKDPNNTKLYNRRQELLEQQWSMIQAAEQEKQAIKSLVQDGINKALEAMQKLIDSYTSALDSQKSLYDYQKNINNQTKNIGNLEKQLASLSGDDSEENRKKLQELRNSLEEAKEGLKETEYEHMISETKELLSELYDNYTETLNSRLDNIDALLAENIAQVNLSSGQIADVLKVVAGDVGYEIQHGSDMIFWTADQKIVPAVALYTSDLMTELSTEAALLNESLTGENTSVVSNLNANGERISNYIGSYADALGMDVETAQKYIGDSVLGIDPNSNIVTVNSSVGTVNGTVSGFKGLFEHNGTFYTLVSGVINSINAMNTAADTRAKQQIWYMQQELAKSNVTASETSNAKAGNGIYDVVDNNVKPEVAAEAVGGALSGLGLTNNSGTAKVNSDIVNNNIPTNVETNVGNVNNTQSNSDHGDGIASLGDKVKFKGDIFYSTWGATPLFTVDELSDAVITRVWEGASHDIDGRPVLYPYVVEITSGKYRGWTGWTPLKNITGYKLGTPFVDENKMAMMNEGGLPETIVRPDGSILTPLARGSMVLNHNATNNLWDMMNEPEKFLDKLFSSSNTLNDSRVIQNDINITIPIAQVNDFDDFMKKFQNSEKVEKLFDHMFDTRLNGGSKFNKYKVSFG